MANSRKKKKETLPQAFHIPDTRQEELDAHFAEIMETEGEEKYSETLARVCAVVKGIPLDIVRVEHYEQKELELMMLAFQFGRVVGHDEGHECEQKKQEMMRSIGNLGGLGAIIKKVMSGESLGDDIETEIHHIQPFKWRGNKNKDKGDGKTPPEAN